MLKNFIRYLFQKLLGFDRYLFVFSRIHILRIRLGLSEKEFRFFVKMIPDDGVILDIGANIGAMTVILAKDKPTAAVYSFEPIAANRKALERVVHSYALKNVQVFSNALGDTDRMIEMIMPFSGSARMHGLSHVWEPGQNQKGETCSVHMMLLDEIPELNMLSKISAIKMDVENFEYFVLKGGKALMAKHRPIVFCELWNNDRRENCFALMKALGYQVKWYHQGSLIDFTDQKVLNFFFLP